MEDWVFHYSDELSGGGGQGSSPQLLTYPVEVHEGYDSNTKCLVWINSLLSLTYLFGLNNQIWVIGEVTYQFTTTWSPAKSSHFLLIQVWKMVFGIFKVNGQGRINHHFPFLKSRLNRMCRHQTAFIIAPFCWILFSGCCSAGCSTDRHQSSDILAPSPFKVYKNHFLDSPLAQKSVQTWQNE